MCPPYFSSALCVRRTGTPVCSLVLSVGSTSPAATDNRREHSSLCVQHYTWHRPPSFKSVRRILQTGSLYYRFQPELWSPRFCKSTAVYVGAGLGPPFFAVAILCLFPLQWRVKTCARQMTCFVCRAL